MRYSVHPRDWIFLKGYGFLSFTKNIGKNIGKNISKNVSGKYSQELVDHAKKCAADALKTSSKRVIQKKAKTISDLIGNKIADAVAKLYNRKFQKIHSKIIQGQLQIRIIKKCRNIFISRRKTRNYWWTEIKIVY